MVGGQGVDAAPSARAPAARSLLCAQRRGSPRHAARRFSGTASAPRSMTGRSRSCPVVEPSNKTHNPKPVVSARTFHGGVGAPLNPSSGGTRDGGAGRDALFARAEDFDKGDVDGDGLLTPEELAGVLVRSCHAREADARSARARAASGTWTWTSDLGVVRAPSTARFARRSACFAGAPWSPARRRRFRRPKEALGADVRDPQPCARRPRVAATRTHGRRARRPTDGLDARVRKDARAAARLAIAAAFLALTRRRPRAS